MAEKSNQGKQQKSQSDQSRRININESDKGSGNIGGSDRCRKGTAGDTENTGPRKK